jgi:hypothetical protein
MPSSSTCVYVCVGVSWSWALRIRLSHLRSSTTDEYGQAEQTKKRVQGALFLLNDRLTQLVLAGNRLNIQSGHAWEKSYTKPLESFFIVITWLSEGIRVCPPLFQIRLETRWTLPTTIIHSVQSNCSDV